MKKSYDELLTLKTFEERFNYLKCPGKIGDDTFGYDRWINQKFYTSQQWRNFRNRIIVRDDGCDMALADFKIPDNEIIVVHHINPMTIDDVINRNPMIFDENNVVCVRDSTHKALHYGDLTSLGVMIGLDGERCQNDTIPWKNLEKGEKTVATNKMRTGIVCSNLLLNVRSAPEIDPGNVIDKLAPGTEVNVYRKIPNENFYMIKYVKGIDTYIGYVMQKFITLNPVVDEDAGTN